MIYDPLLGPFPSTSPKIHTKLKTLKPVGIPEAISSTPHDGFRCALRNSILFTMQVPFSSFSEPRFYSIIPYIISILTSRSPRAFARVPIPTQVSDRDTLISTKPYIDFRSRADPWVDFALVFIFDDAPSISIGNAVLRSPVDALTLRWPCPKQTNNGTRRCVRVRECCGRVLSRNGGDWGCQGVAPRCTGRKRTKRKLLNKVGMYLVCVSDFWNSLVYMNICKLRHRD